MPRSGIPGLVVIKRGICVPHPSWCVPAGCHPQAALMNLEALPFPVALSPPQKPFFEKCPLVHPWPASPAQPSSCRSHRAPRVSSAPRAKLPVPIAVWPNAFIVEDCSDKPWLVPPCPYRPRLLMVRWFCWDTPFWMGSVCVSASVSMSLDVSHLRVRHDLILWAQVEIFSCNWSLGFSKIEIRERLGSSCQKLSSAGVFHMENLLDFPSFPSITWWYLKQAPSCWVSLNRVFFPLLLIYIFL